MDFWGLEARVRSGAWCLRFMGRWSWWGGHLLDAAVNDVMDRRARNSRRKCALLLCRHRLGYILTGLFHPESHPVSP